MVGASHSFHACPVTLRPAQLEDAPALASLATQLGYPSTPSQVEARMAGILDDPDQLIVVAVAETQAVGWAHAYVCSTVESDKSAELGGLLVDESYRGKGLGGKLMEKVEDWARQKGCQTVSLRSNIIRQEAHRFYLARGYDQIKTQYTFRKRL